MDTTDAAISDLHTAIVAAARAGATYQWIAGVLAGCLAADSTMSQARKAAIATLARPSVKSVRPPAA